MAEFFRSHQYFVSLLVWLVIYIFILVLFKKFYRIILVSSLLSLPQAFFSFIVVPGYWNPDKIPFLGIGLEDFLFSFFSGGIVCTGLLLFRRVILFNFRLSLLVKRFVVCLFFGVVTVTVLYLAGIRSMTNPFITMILWIVAILIYRFSYWRFSLISTIVYLLIYSFGIKTGFWLWPSLSSFWSTENLSNIRFLRIPVEEMIWAFLYGGAWSLAIMFFIDLRPQASNQIAREEKS